MAIERPHHIQSLPESSRPRERLLAVGERSLSHAELLAITLRTGNGQENALHLAQRLLSQFKGLPGIAQASVTELTAVRGIGQVKAIEIKAALELGRRLMTDRPEEKPSVTSPHEAANILMPDMSHLPQEQLRTILLDTRNRVMSIPTIYVGSLNSTAVRLAEIFRPAIKDNAAAIIVCHNHPSGDCSPSPEDISTTRNIVKAGQLLDIPVLDHIIIGNQKYTSLKEKGAGFE